MVPSVKSGPKIGLGVHRRPLQIFLSRRRQARPATLCLDFLHLHAIQGDPNAKLRHKIRRYGDELPPPRFFGPAVMVWAYCFDCSGLSGYYQDLERRAPGT
jgi:hypothetical protein